MHTARSHFKFWENDRYLPYFYYILNTETIRRKQTNSGFGNKEETVINCRRIHSGFGNKEGNIIN